MTRGVQVCQRARVGKEGKVEHAARSPMAQAEAWFFGSAQARHSPVLCGLRQTRPHAYVLLESNLNRPKCGFVCILSCLFASHMCYHNLAYLPTK